jgi:hypothetical protein
VAASDINDESSPDVAPGRRRVVSPAAGGLIDLPCRNALTLPVRGTWFVVSGGRSAALNSHWNHPDQQHAVDLVVLDEGGSTHRGDGKRLDQYFAFKRRVCAASAGTVVRAIAALPDNDIGATDESNIDGNHVMIAHDDGTFALYDHLQCGSLTVSVGEAVMTGQPIGRVGNSGNTTQPHLHMQLQTTDDLDPRVAISIPMVFRSLVVNGAHVYCGELPGSVLVRHRYPK